MIDDGLISEAGANGTIRHFNRDVINNILRTHSIFTGDEEDDVNALQPFDAGDGVPIRLPFENEKRVVGKIQSSAKVIGHALARGFFQKLAIGKPCGSNILGVERKAGQHGKAEEQS